MGQKQENSLPEEDRDTKLPEQFGEFFLSKIINIRKLLTQKMQKSYTNW